MPESEEEGSVIYTIGHSTHSIENCIGLLRKNGVTALADVRSHPYSRYNPQFNREPLKSSLKADGLEYVFLGKELGARSEDRTCYQNGRVQFELVARTESFKQGIARVQNGMKTHRICLMCAEKDPIACHRAILVCRNLRSLDIDIRHILEEGSLESHLELERRLMRTLRISENHLFNSFEQQLERAYDVQAGKMAFVEKETEEPMRQGEGS